MWSETLRGAFLWGVIYQVRTGTTIRALHPDFFVLIRLQRINLSSVRAELDGVQALQL